jgi:uncharacterized membrane protein
MRASMSVRGASVWLGLAAMLAVTCGLADATAAAGVTICNGTSQTVGFALGYGRPKSLASTGPFEAKGGTCETFLKDVPKGPFYIYGGVPTGALSWTAGSDKSAQVFCLANGPHFVIRNSDYLKEGKLACPDNAVIGFKLIPTGPEKRPKFTFTEGNADRP